MTTCKELNRTQRAERSYPKPVRNNTRAWLAFFVGLVVGMGILADWLFHPTVPANLTHPATATAN